MTGGSSTDATLGHLCGEGVAILLRQPLEVLAQHHRLEEAGQLFDRAEFCGFFVQPGLDLFEPGSLQASFGRLWVSVYLGVLPTDKSLPEALLAHGLLRGPGHPGDVALTSALRHQSTSRL